jgi:HAMP domain-containing protein
MSKSKEELFVEAIGDQHSKEVAYRISHPDYKGKNAKHLGNQFYKKANVQELLEAQDRLKFGMIRHQLPNQLSRTMQKISEILEGDLSVRDLTSLAKTQLEVADRVGLSASKITEIRQTIKHEASVDDALAVVESFLGDNPAAASILASPVEGVVVEGESGGEDETSSGDRQAKDE